MIRMTWRGLGLALLVAVMVAAVALAVPQTAHADDVEWSNRGVRTDDPRSITFQVRARIPGGLSSAVVNYRVLNPDGAVGGSVRVEPPSGTEVDLSATLETITGNRYIPVGSQFVYTWEFETVDGTRTTTPEESFTFLDGRYRWESRSADGVTVFWYGDNERQADLALEATRASIEDISALLRVEMPYPVTVVVWRNSADGQAAQRGRGGGGTFDFQVITGGSRVAPDLLHIYDGLGNFVDVARHEAGHLVTRVAGDGPFTRIPSWLDEGTAVYAQTTPGSYGVAIEQAIRTDQTIRLRTMTSPINQPALINVFYGQSWSTVSFMIEEWGEERFAELFRVIKSGSRTDDALEEVYGFDQDGLYNLWRQHHGLEPIEFEPRAQTGGMAAPPEATRAPLGIPTGGVRSGPGEQPAETPAPGQPAPAAPAVTADGGGVPTTAIIVLAVTVLLAAALGGLGFVLLRAK